MYPRLVRLSTIDSVSVVVAATWWESGGMAVRDGRLRPEMDRFEHGGYAVTLIDGDAALAAADDRRVELLRDAAFPPTVREATLSVTRDPRDPERYLLDAGARTGPHPRPDRPPLSALGGDPVSTLLSWRMAAGDRWATRVVDGMDVVAERVSRWLSPPRPTPRPLPTATIAPRSWRR